MLVLEPHVQSAHAKPIIFLAIRKLTAYPADCIDLIAQKNTVIISSIRDNCNTMDALCPRANASSATAGVSLLRTWSGLYGGLGNLGLQISQFWPRLLQIPATLLSPMPQAQSDEYAIRIQ